MPAAFDPIAEMIKAARRRAQRQSIRAMRRSDFALHHASAGLNGTRAVARRVKQIATGQLRQANGLVRC